MTEETKEITEEIATMAGSKATKHNGSADGALYKSALENAGVNVMMCDLDLNITYANQATHRLVADNLTVFEEAFPGFNPAELLGTCLDTFHKDPAYQRRILGNPKNLPHQADIQIGSKTFALNISAIYDDKGEYTGNCLEWQDATEARKRADEAARLTSSVEGSATASMTVDRDLTITYMNPATTALIGENIDEFSGAFPNVDFTQVIGVCIDVFHKDPAYQRKILGDPKNLPHQADISVGNLTFALNISAMTDVEGNHIGANLEWQDVSKQKLAYADFAGQIAAIGKSQAVIEFNMDGMIITANDNFLGTLGYALEEIQGKHHSMFVDAAYKASTEYAQFWDKLNRGEYEAAEYKRIGKGGKEVWIQASYNPILDLNGKPFKVVKYATDVTEQKLAAADFSGQIDAIGKAQAVIEFNMDGTIITANDNFLGALGYSLGEVQGKHHSMFVDTAFKASAEYKEFWEKLNRGEYEAAEYKRIGKGGKEVFIQASYNPILDLNGKPFKVVKYATDITKQTVMNNLYKEDLSTLIEASKNGDLSKRGDVDQLDEIYGPLMQGTNDIIDAILAPINEAGTILERVAQKDLTARVTGDYKGGHAAIKNNLNEAVQNLEAAMSQALQATGQVNSASGQIAQGSQALAQGSSEQASSLEEISASLEELTAMTNQNADNATQANSLAQDQQTAATKGADAMKKMEEAINMISSSAEQTSKIVKTIDEIAFQTNLLALNAAVEAARAGDAGKGFAVVAEEVRSLAARSAEAAKNTAELIEQSVKNAEGGVRITEEVGAVLAEVVTGSEKAGSLIGEIAAASKEQASGIGQINDGVAQLDTVTQQNAANSEESAAAAEELNAQAQSLAAIISTFKIAQGNGQGNGGAPQLAGPPVPQAYGLPPQQQLPPPAYQGAPPQMQSQAHQAPLQAYQAQAYQGPAQAYRAPAQAYQTPQQPPFGAPGAPGGQPAFQQNLVPPQQGYAPQGRAPVQPGPAQERRPQDVIPLDDSDLNSF